VSIVNHETMIVLLLRQSHTVVVLVNSDVNQLNYFIVRLKVDQSSGRSKNFEKGGRKNLLSHLLQMHTMVYMPLTRKKVALKKIEPIGGGRPNRPPP